MTFPACQQPGKVRIIPRLPILRIEPPLGCIYPEIELLDQEGRQLGGSRFHVPQFRPHAIVGFNRAKARIGFFPDGRVFVVGFVFPVGCGHVGKKRIVLQGAGQHILRALVRAVGKAGSVRASGGDVHDQGLQARAKALDQSIPQLAIWPLVRFVADGRVGIQAILRFAIAGEGHHLTVSAGER